MLRKAKKIKEIQGTLGKVMKGQAKLKRRRASIESYVRRRKAIAACLGSG
jgi:hypothetical protein